MVINVMSDLQHTDPQQTTTHWKKLFLVTSKLYKYEQSSREVKQPYTLSSQADDLGNLLLLINIMQELQ